MKELETFQIAPNQPDTDDELISSLERAEDKINELIKAYNDLTNSQE